jgi:hypothetical protein
MRHRALAVGVVDGDAVVPAEVPAVGAEGAVGDVSQEYVAPALLRLDGCPEDCAHCRVVVDALDDELLAVAERCRLVRGCEVAAVGGAVKEDEGDVVADDSVHPPRRVQRRAHRAQGDAPPVLVGVEVPAAHAALQADEGAVGEELHRSCALVGGGGRAGFSACVLGRKRGPERRKAEQSRAGVCCRGGQFQGAVGEELQRVGTPSDTARWAQQNQLRVQKRAGLATAFFFPMLRARRLSLFGFHQTKFSYF